MVVEIAFWIRMVHFLDMFTCMYAYLNDMHLTSSWQFGFCHMLVLMGYYWKKKKNHSTLQKLNHLGRPKSHGARIHQEILGMFIFLAYDRGCVRTICTFLTQKPTVKHIYIDLGFLGGRRLCACKNRSCFTHTVGWLYVGGFLPRWPYVCLCLCRPASEIFLDWLVKCQEIHVGNQVLDHFPWREGQSEGLWSFVLEHPFTTFLLSWKKVGKCRVEV